MPPQQVRAAPRAALALCAAARGGDCGGSAGCGSPPPCAAPCAINVTLSAGTFAGYEYLLKLPEGYDPATPSPVLAMFHGWQRGGAWVEGAWELDFGSREFVVVAPNGPNDSPGRARSWNIGEAASSCKLDSPDLLRSCYASCGAPGQNGCSNCSWTTCLDTVQLAADAVADALAAVCADTARVSAYGNSNGGMFIPVLAADPRTAPLFNAYVVDHGLPHKGMNTAPLIPRPLLGIWSEMDGSMPPFAVGKFRVDGAGNETVVVGWGQYYYNTARNVTALWARAGGCAGGWGAAEVIPGGSPGNPNATPPVPASHGDLHCVTAAGCPGGAEVVECIEQGGAHENFWAARPPGQACDYDYGYDSDACSRPDYGAVIRPFLRRAAPLTPAPVVAPTPAPAAGGGGTSYGGGPVAVDDDDGGHSHLGAAGVAALVLAALLVGTAAYAARLRGRVRELALPLALRERFAASVNALEAGTEMSHTAQ